MKRIILTGVAISALNLTGCALSDTAVIPQGDNTYKMVSTAYSEHGAIQGGLNRANEICKEQGKRAVVLNSKTVYQGVDKTTGALTDTLSSLSTALSNQQNGTAAIAPSTRRSDDYRATLVFRCS